MPHLGRLRFLAFASSILAASTVSHATVRYVLQNRGTFQEGCFAPCLCPVMETGSLDGTFELGLVTVGDVFDAYSVEDVRWLAEVPLNERSIAGDGTYKVSTVTDQNEMSADLTIDQNVPEHFTSGTVPTHAVFPEIDVTISKNGIYCRDTVMDVRARPTPRLAME